MTGLNFQNLFDSFKNIRVGVIGDLMLDTYWIGSVDRISPEAPVPIVAVSKREQRIGGAGNVALNLVSLGAMVDVLGLIGNDDDGALLLNLQKKNHIGTDFLVKSDERPTTNKIRIISRNQHMMRLDAEITDPLSAKEEKSLLTSLEKYIKLHKPDIIIFEDYNKGVLTESVITKSIELCKREKVLTSVDPKRKNFFSYRGVDIFKPNLHEAKEGLNILFDGVSQELLEQIHLKLHEKLKNKVSLVTLSEQGVFYQSGKESMIIPTHIRSIADVSGAGDTVIAVASLVYASTKNVRLMAEMANIAGGLVCEEVGTVAINKTRLQTECEMLLS